ncbi:MAG: dienelactone hydrolase family protein [Pseudomonadales bacterium]|jgi:dienelactone hydrolase|nr:dienelactone hydrolase family protein [Pseudomonadales bacterium]MDP4640547.1 dienelactone hydrolase family protein [Pseudomonadales bacterium]MDP4764806.1 dienelactone hydrolase family protein [Pseudomonadales bacterium]MDP4874728.1 dienelactone hydrolase family protein [Pseudomonadales bacterium]MDP4911060.1 dienelactone hydrolase family protein [Pseudomonadales bacterium]
MQGATNESKTQSKTIEYKDGETVLEGYIAWDDSIKGPRPAVLIAHDWTGRRDFATAKADEMARLGYVGFALDMYGKGVFGSDDDVEANSALMGPFATDRAKLRTRMLAALAAVRGLASVDSSRVAAMGYCFGGMCVLELARAGADVGGVISVHGIFAPGDVANAAITAKVLCLHGHDDPMVPPAQVLAFEQEMTAAAADWQVHAYGGTMHAFTNPGANNPAFGVLFNPVANHRASQSIINFMDEIFCA